MITRVTTLPGSKRAYLLCSIGLSLYIVATLPAAHAQPEINWNVFTHIEAYQSSEDTDKDPFRLGESAFFATGRLTDRWSFLTEVSYEIPKYRDQSFKLERLRMRYDLDKDNWIIFGKMHTPVNYWNDNYHHGRLFFPTINRPKSFSRFIPIHDIGLRFAGSAMFGSGIGYDVVIGSGQSAGDDMFSEGVQSYTAALNWTPNSNLTLMGSYYRDTILDHQVNPFHNHNHEGDTPMAMPMAMPMDSMTTATSGDDISYELFSFSMHWSGAAFKGLTELSMNRTDDGDFNTAAFQYIGYRLSDDITAYALYDMVDVDKNEIHFMPGRDSRYGIGVEYAFGVNVTLKTELRRRDDHTGGLEKYNNEIQLQLSLGF